MPKKKVETVQEPIVFPDKYKILGADLSLRRSAFCLLSVNKENEEIKIKVRKLISIDNKTNKKKCHGELLEDIQKAFLKLTFGLEDKIYYVRETEVMNRKVPSERNVSKVVGIMDWTLWKLQGDEWYSIYPVTIKKYVAGSGKAEKSEVAAALEKYVGKQEYACDDESDATAVAIAWLIQQGELEEIL